MSMLGERQQQQGLQRRLIPLTRQDLQMAMIVTRREVRDSFRDWRIIIPIVLLTLFFPLLMNFTAERLLSFVTGYGATLVGTRLIPFLLLVVGFFPTSFSLVIALETFVGEKERKSLEPLLATPLTNVQLYLGKILASVVPPLFASYLGIAVYLIGLAITIDWVPSLQLLLLTLTLTTIQGILMVSGAVVVSSQTTSARAANLLASFIIVPMALLIQFEAVVLFWGNYTGLWWVVLGLLVATLILMRMGVHVFNREELLGRDIDQIRVRWLWSKFWHRFSGRQPGGRYLTPRQWYRQTLALLPGLKQPFLLTGLALLGSILLGLYLTQLYPFPPALQEQLQNIEGLEALSGLQGMFEYLPMLIFLHNLRVVALAALLGVFTFGVLGLVVFMLPWGLLSYIGGQLLLAGEDPVRFLLATVAPHAILELPVLMLVTAAALRWQTAFIAPPPDKTVSENWLEKGADFMRILLGLVIPLLLLAALLEAFVTPWVVVQVYR